VEVNTQPQALSDTANNYAMDSYMAIFTVCTVYNIMQNKRE